MPEVGVALRDDIANADKKGAAKPSEGNDEFEQALARKLSGFISLSDAREEARRAEDRIGGNILFSNHWAVQMPRRRAAYTVNIAAALLADKISLITKNRPVPIIEDDGNGDEQGVPLMRGVIMNWWEDQDLDRKLEHALWLSNSTRTSAIKCSWDPALNSGAGGIAAGVLPGWRCIIDPRASSRDRLAFGGDRTVMPRSRAMQFYPKAAKKIQEAQAAYETGPHANSPLDDVFSRGGGGLRTGPGVVTINGVPSLTANGNVTVSTKQLKELVEVCEIYWRDPQLVDRIVPKKDERTGEVVRKPKFGEDGLPMFKETARVTRTIDDEEIDLPGFELELEDEMETKLVPKYPFWRRSTMLLPDRTIVDDCAWDFEYPYAYFIDGQPLEGLWHRGSLLEVRGLQTDFNVSVSLLTDNQRFGSMRAGVAYDGADLDQNVLSIAPGDVLRVRGPKGSFEWMEFPKADSAWFEKFKFDLDMMRLIFGLDGVMSGQAQGRIDSGTAYDTFTDISGARLIKCANRMERSISDLIKIVGSIAQKAYTEKHAVRVEHATGRPTDERITPESLRGNFRFKVATGSSLAWTDSAKRQRLNEDLANGVIDKVGYWQALNYPDWQNIKARMESEPPALQPAPPKRTRQSIAAPKTPKPKAAK